MTFFRDHRSIKTPAKGVTIMNGAKLKNAAKAKIKGLPVVSARNQIIPNLTILEPRIDIHCPVRKNRYENKFVSGSFDILFVNYRPLIL